ncbi:YopX family protein [Streptococcus suis]|uniref:YopX family protein n=1 Tax=Streptococcus suis TaxID=1307 RepID=UPI000CF45DB1
MIPKFRAWDTFDEDMVTDIFFSWQDCGYESLNECLSDERWKFMQSTGLFDKNGKEVYIGDIVKCTSGCSHEVIFLKEYGGRYIGGMPAIYLSDIREGYAWTEDEEIIGNIYENPELMEEAEND